MDMNLVLHCYKLWCPSQGSVLGPLLLLLYINDLNQAIKSCKVHPFADDTNLLSLSKSIKKLNKQVNADLSHLAGSLIG